jgi:hypothetical protein
MTATKIYERRDILHDDALDERPPFDMSGWVGLRPD